ncbi:hypothetical protein [Paludibacter sp. 221]|nr:hypothetical protein [Paludibacter sp. 221]
MDEKQITKEFYEDIRKLVEESEKIYRLAEQEYAPMYGGKKEKSKKRFS